jgi:hypothetical protein
MQEYTLRLPQDIVNASKGKPEMKQLILLIVICVLAVSFAGCAKPCFYQAGKSIEQCEHDLLDCLYSAQPTCLCMQDRGYEYRDVNTLPHNGKRIMVIAPSAKYWIVDGLGMVSDDRKVLSKPKPQDSKPNTPAERRIRYRVQKDASGKLLKDSSGNFIFVPVYEDQQRAAYSEQTGGKQVRPAQDLP